MVGRTKLQVDPHSRSIELGHPSLLAGSNGRLLVVEEYAFIFERVDEQYHETPAGAALVLGEPGTSAPLLSPNCFFIKPQWFLGKTLCLLYILIRLLMRRTNVVRLYIPESVRWSLIDTDFRAAGEPPNPLIRETFFVIQANGPDPTYPATWTRSGRLTGVRICVMPLWSCEDLLAM